MSENHNQKFAQGICFYKLFWIFLIGSIFGTYYEQILHLVSHYYQYHEFEWVLRRGVIYGPISPVYGAGAVLYTLLLMKKEHSDFGIFLKGALIGGGFEYGISFLQETFLGTVSWNYKGRFLNINGRTTIPYMMVWGLIALVFARILYPFLSRCIESFPVSFGVSFTKILIVLLCVDFFISWGALFRQQFRHKGYEPITFLGEFFDQHYDDEMLRKYYTNMQFVRD